MSESDNFVEPEDVLEDWETLGPVAPLPPELDDNDPRTALQARVATALGALPGYFSFDSPVSGVNATDLFNLSSLLGAGIEVEVVKALNRLRDVWDPDSEWLGYRFERSSQAFPDVRLVRRSSGAEDIAMGIELKGWFLLSKEAVPSLRYQVAPAACAPHDLVCVVPWYLSNAVAGIPAVTEPWVESALYVAQWRDYWWQSQRKTTSDTGISYPPDATPYPAKADLVLAVPAYDGGDNFGRIPRARPIMDEFIASSLNHEVLGITCRNWLAFLKLHTDTASSDAIAHQLEAQVDAKDAAKSRESAREIAGHLDAIRRLIG